MASAALGTCRRPASLDSLDGKINYLRANFTSGVKMQAHEIIRKIENTIEDIESHPVSTKTDSINTLFEIIDAISAKEQIASSSVRYTYAEFLEWKKQLQENWHVT